MNVKVKMKRGDDGKSKKGVNDEFLIAEADGGV
jgi:hypothetical protein